MTTRGSGAGRGTGAAGLSPFAVGPVVGVAGVLAVVLAVVSGRYGFHRDELYFLLAGRHPDWGYVDQPPLTPLLARLSADVLGDSPSALRAVSVVLSAVSVALTALLARELGAGRGGQVLAAGCCACSGYVLAIGHLLSTSTFDLAAELTVLLLALRLLRTGDGRWWPALGAAVGIALLNKQLVVSLALALAVGAVAARPREVRLREVRLREVRLREVRLREVRRRLAAAGGWRPVLGVAGALTVALAIAGPTLWWQAAHGWPELGVARRIGRDNGVTGRLLFLPLQALQFSPFLVPIAVVGFRRLLRDAELRWARPVAFAYPVLCLMVLVGGGKPYYPLPLLLAITAAGCETVVRRVRRPVRSLGGRMVLAGVISALAALPVLPVSAIAATNRLDADQGEQVGWPELVRATAVGWDTIPADRRGHAVLLTSNYGEAGAIARYGPEPGLPGAYSGHMSLADWGPPPDGNDGPVLLVHPDGRRALEQWFTDCRTVARVDNGRGVGNEEQHAEIVLCDGPHQPWSVLWPSLRHY